MPARINKIRESGFDSSIPEYGVWCTMKSRCKNKKSISYERYGARGISYCESWEYFSNFIKDMGSRPSSKHQIDRINNNGNYCKENCRWVLPIKNSSNRRLRKDSVFGSYVSKSGNWRSLITIENKSYVIGTFKTKEEAQEAYKVIFKEWYGFEPSKEIYNAI